MVGVRPALLLACFLVIVRSVEDRAYWFAKAGAELDEALSLEWNRGVAKNVLLFVGDGMGPNTVTAARIYRAGESSSLAFERFPHVGLIKTYSADKQVPDSASTANAMFTGVKNNYETLGVDTSVRVGDCANSLRPEHQLSSIASWAQAAGKHTGIVTTTRVTHATPAAMYAHCPNRRWECDNKMPANTTATCKDIARQLVEDEPGASFQVVMGGGRQCLVTNTSVSESDPRDSWACSRADGRDLVREWVERKRRTHPHLTHRYLKSAGDLESLDTSQVDYVLGLFANGHMRMDHERDRSPSGMPSLAQMTKAAIEILSKNDKGFLLMVEGGMIDYAHHRGIARAALDETAALDEAVSTALDWLRQHRMLESTLVVVTSDHSHSLAINGNPSRGNNILGIAQNSKADKVPFTTLLYATGGPESQQREGEGEGSRRRDPSRDDTTGFGYHQQAAVLSDEAHHDGGDVAVYAIGPQAHLFHSVHEQNYIAHVIAYAAKIGHHANVRTTSHSTSASLSILTGNCLSLVTMLLLFLCCFIFR